MILLNLQPDRPWTAKSGGVGNGRWDPRRALLCVSGSTVRLSGARAYGEIFRAMALLNTHGPLPLTLISAFHLNQTSV